MPTVHLLIKGKVQGVFYRSSAKTKAERLGLKGWVKNRKDGTVEGKATGSKSSLEEFIDWCRVGPPGAFVTEVVVNYPGEEDFEDFIILR